MQGAGPAYWLDLFTGKTWDEFRKAGATISGFRQGSRGVCERIRQGDILLAYVTGVKRWVGALEVVGPSSDSTRIWADDDFPVRFTVKPLVLLDAIYGVGLEDLEGEGGILRRPTALRGIPRLLPKESKPLRAGQRWEACHAASPGRSVEPRRTAN